MKHWHWSVLPTFQQKLEKGVDETHLTGTPVVKVLSVVAHSSLGNDTNENKENDSEKNCKKTKSNSRWKRLAFRFLYAPKLFEVINSKKQT